MPRSAEAVLADLAAFQGTDDTWGRLQELLDELWAAGPVPAAALPVLFGVLERHPDDDGYGVLWAVLHGLESLAGYEAEMVRSVRRRPARFNLTMVGRCLNAGTRSVGEDELLPLIRAAADAPDASAGVRSEARDWLEHFDGGRS
jgi:hypothetical protein